MVPDSYTAWHAGKSKWKKFLSLNKYSIGIEITTQVMIMAINLSAKNKLNPYYL